MQAQEGADNGGRDPPRRQLRIITYKDIEDAVERTLASGILDWTEVWNACLLDENNEPTSCANLFRERLARAAKIRSRFVRCVDATSFFI